MARKKQTKGICQFCNDSVSKGWMGRHLAKCEARNNANAKAKGKPQALYYLRVSDAYSTDFWLDLEVRGDAKLKDIDYYLRQIWLECCGHMSMFNIQAWGEELTMQANVATMFSQFNQLTHLYDFGSTSETRIARVAVREGVPLSPKKKPIRLLARNEQPFAACLECGDSAEFFCIECLYEDDINGYLCAKHAETHPHDDYGPPQELLNSPRVGVCGELISDAPPY